MTNDTERRATPEPSNQTHVDHESLPFVPAGEPLLEHEVYIDVLNPGHGPFRALAGQTAGSGNGYVAENEVDPAVWDLLVREDGETRLQLELQRDAASTEQQAVDPGITGIGHAP